MANVVDCKAAAIDTNVQFVKHVADKEMLTLIYRRYELPQSDAGGAMALCVSKLVMDSAEVVGSGWNLLSEHAAELGTWGLKV